MGNRWERGKVKEKIEEIHRGHSYYEICFEGLIMLKVKKLKIGEMRGFEDRRRLWKRSLRGYEGSASNRGGETRE